MPKRVLLVEDEDSLRSVLADILRLEGYEVEALGDGAAALERVACEPQPQVIILDLIMPIVSGPEFLMAAGPMLRSVPVIVMSGAAAELPAGAVVAARLRKPVSTEELLRTVEYCFRLASRSGARQSPQPASGKTPSAKQAG